jgi:hypothetical protein
MNSLLKNLSVVIGEVDSRTRDRVLEKLEEKNEIHRIDFELLVMDIIGEREIVNTNSILKNLAIVIGEVDSRTRDRVLEKLEEKNEIHRIDFEILMIYLANRGEIKLDI